MMAEHTVKAFDEDITRLRGLVAETARFGRTFRRPRRWTRW